MRRYGRQADTDSSSQAGVKTTNELSLGYLKVISECHQVGPLEQESPRWDN
jgi:hypothetical protein